MAQLNLAVFPRQPVWRLLVVVLASLGCYTAVWLHDVSSAVNRAMPDRRIGSWFFPVSAALSSASLGLGLAELLTYDGTGLHVATSAVFEANLLFLVIWTFKVRNRVNVLLRSTKRSPFWLHGLWTAVVEIFYMQKQVNAFRETISLLSGKSRLAPAH